MLKKIFLIILSVFSLASVSYAGNQSVLTISIQGIACPFCVDVLIENVKKQSFTSDAKTSADEKELIVSLKPGMKVDMDKLNKVIRDSGYEPLNTSQNEISNDMSGKIFTGHVSIKSQPCNTCHLKK